jgi:hypothetical protein
MEIQGKVSMLLPLQTGAGKNGQWKKQDFILETEGQVPRKICFSLWGDKVDQYALAPGDQVEVSFDLESREFNGRWYTDAKAWKINKKSASGSPAPKAYTEEPPYEPETDNLPF